MRGKEHVGFLRHSGHHLLDVDHGGDVAPAMANKHTEARLFVGHVMLGRIERPGRQRVARGGQQLHRHRGLGGTGLGHGFRDDQFWKAPPTKTPGREVVNGVKRSVAQKPYSFNSTPRRRALPQTAVTPVSMPTDNTTRSKSFSCN